MHELEEMYTDSKLPIKINKKASSLKKRLDNTQFVFAEPGLLVYLLAENSNSSIHRLNSVLNT